MAKRLVRAQARAREAFKAAYGPHLINFTRGQVISDHQLAKHLLDTGAPVKDESQYEDVETDEEKDQAEAARLAAEQAAKEAAEKAEAERLAAEQAEAERLAAEAAAANQGNAGSPE